MPKQADIRVQVPCCTAAHFWNVIYERPEAIERYHTSFNASTATDVTPWVGGQRNVNFTMPLKLPDFLKRLVGLDSVAVSEVQRVVWHGGGAFTVSSETNITNMIGAGRFTTALQLTVTERQNPQQQHPPPPPPPHSHHPHQQADGAEASDSGSTAGVVGSMRPLGTGGGGVADGGWCAGVSMVQLVYSVRCAAASIPWPMSATIENVMSEKALVSMQSFLEFCTQLLLEEEHTAGAAAAAAAATGAAVTAAGEAAPADGGVAPSTVAAAAAAVLEPGAATRQSDSGAVIATGGPRVGGAAGAPPPLSPGLTARGSLRHRWPSITCSQDIGVPGVGVGLAAPPPVGDPFLLRRQDTAGGAAGDLFWDAPETFGTASVSGLSSGALSPRLSGSQLRGSADCGAAAAAATGTGAGSAAPPHAATGAAALEAQQLAVAVDRLAAAVVALDGKLDKVLLLQERQQQQLRDMRQTRHHRQQQQQRGGAGCGSGSDGDGGPPDYLLDHPRASSSMAAVAERRAAATGGGDPDVRWMFRVTLAVLLATLLVMSYWLLHPTATGFRPHGGGGAGGDSPQASLPLVSVLRLDGSASRTLGGGGGGNGGGRLRGGDGGSAEGDSGGGGADVAEGRARVALQVLGSGEDGGDLHDGAGSHGGAGARRGRPKGGRGAGGGGGQGRRRRQRQRQERS